MITCGADVVLANVWATEGGLAVKTPLPVPVAVKVTGMVILVVPACEKIMEPAVPVGRLVRVAGFNVTVMF